ncbi:hypothetical protein MXD60_06830 [Frankia sp. AgB32]|nr:hypothetical protein [Frankia sp. AgB32]
MRAGADSRWLAALLSRQAGLDVRRADRLLVVDDASAAPAHRTVIAELTADRATDATLLVLVGPATTGIGPPTCGPEDEPGNPPGGWSLGDVWECPFDSTLGGWPDDLDDDYQPDLYASYEDTSDEDTADENTADEAVPAPPVASRAVPTPGDEAVMPAIVWLSAVGAEPSAPPEPESLSEPTSTARDQGAGREAGSREWCVAPDDGGAMVRACVDALRSPEVFDEVCREVSAMPGRLAFPALAVVVGRLPDEVLRTMQIEAAERFVALAGRQSPVGSALVEAAPAAAARPGYRAARLAHLTARLACVAMPHDCLAALVPRLSPLPRRLPRTDRWRRRRPTPIRRLTGSAAEIVEEIAACADALAGSGACPPARERPGISQAAAVALAEQAGELAALFDADLADLAAAALARPAAAGPEHRLGPGPGRPGVGRRVNDLLDAYHEQLRQAGVLEPPSFGSTATRRAELGQRVWRTIAIPAGDAPVVRLFASGRQTGRSDPRPEAGRSIVFAPHAARPSSAAARTTSSDPVGASTDGPSAAVPRTTPVWTSSTLVAGVLRLVPPRDATCLDVLFPETQT